MIQPLFMTLLLSERAYAYRLKYEALKHQEKSERQIRYYDEMWS